MCGADSLAFKILGKRLNQSQGKNPRNKMGITTTVVKCKNCALVFSNPLPIPNSLQDHYGVPPESYWQERYFTIREDYFEQETKTLKSLYPFQSGDKALDIGAGLGKCMISLARSGFDVYGIEPSKPFFERAIQKMGISPERIMLNSVEEALFPDDHFDFITFGAVLEHLYDPSASIEKSMRWLKKGGIMHIEVPSSDWLIARISNIFYRIQGLDYVTNISPMHEPYHLYEFSLKSFNKNAELLGYHVCHFEYYIAQTYMPKALDLILVPYMKATQTGMQLCIWLKKNSEGGSVS